MIKVLPTLLEAILILLPTCLGHIAQFPPQAIGKNKILLRNREETKNPYLKPTLSIRSSPDEVVNMKAFEAKYLECEAGGTPPPLIHWLKDGERMPQSTFDKVHFVGNPKAMADSLLGLGFTRSRLFLDCAVPSDAGLYTCVAENEFFREHRTSQVVVEEGPQDYDDAECLTKTTFGLPARIVMWTHNRLEFMGTDVQLFCRSSGDPQPQTQWFRSFDKPLTDPKKYEVLPNGDLVIKNLAWADMGGYTCQVKNSNGEDEASLFLYPTMPENNAQG